VVIQRGEEVIVTDFDQEHGTYIVEPANDIWKGTR
jgi:hypothetical protein